MLEPITWTNSTRKLSELIPWPINPAQIGKDEAKRLEESLAEFGQIQTIAVSPTNEIYDGHQRQTVWGASRKFGMDYEVDVRVSSRELTEQERKKLVIYLRKGTVGEFDFDLLANNFEFGDLIDWGFNEKELLGLDFGDEKPEDPGAQIDKAEELREKWGVKLGQLWQLGEHRLICGDCTDKAVVERVMGGEKAVLTVTSPPYAVGKEYEKGVTFENHLKLLCGFADRTIEITIPGGFIFTNFGEIAPQSHASPMTGSDRQCIYLVSKDYWIIFHEERKCDLYAQRIWYKPFNRLQQPFWSYHTSIPHHQEWEHIWTWRTPGGNGDRVCDWDISVHAVWDTRNESTEDKPLTRHVAAFPVCLPERAIKAHSLRGEVIYEPFSGSGTTLIVSEQTGRECRAVEIAPQYVAVTLQRFYDMNQIMPVLLEESAHAPDTSDPQA